MILKHLRHHCWLNQILISKDTHPIKEWNGQKQEKDGIFMLLKTMTCISFFQSSYFISTGCTFYTILWSWCFLASRGLDIWPLMWMIHSKMRLLRLIIRETMIPTVMFKIEIITLLFKPLEMNFFKPPVVIAWGGLSDHLSGWIHIVMTFLWSSESSSSYFNYWNQTICFVIYKPF